MRGTFFFFLLLGMSSSATTTEAEFRSSLKNWSSQELAGQLLFVGMRNIEQVQKIQPAGVILFAWNMRSVEKVQALTWKLSRISKKLKLPLMIATDHEGGEVIRIRRGVTNFPDAAVIAASNDTKLSERIGFLTGQELRALGLNTNLAPVLDLGNARSFLRNRVWGSDPEKVARLTSSYIHGLERAGVLSVAKHFPGHGSTTVDSHYNLPVSYKRLSQLWSADLKPFREAVKNNVPALMTAHVELPLVERVPASFSKKMLSTLLREKMGYEGVIITDDLEMGAAKGSSGASLSALSLQALKAGSDLVMLVWNQQEQLKVRDRLAKAIESGELKRLDVYEKIVRTWRAKQRFEINAESTSDIAQVGKRETRALVSKVIRAAVLWRAGNETKVLSPFRSKKNQAWRVWLPSHSTAKMWKKLRPRDQAELIPKASGGAFLGELKMALAKKQPIVLVTPPRASLSSEVFDQILSVLNTANDTESRSSLLWVHQGSDPIPLSAVNKSDLKFGIMTLSSASLRSFHAFTNYLKDNRLF